MIGEQGSILLCELDDGFVLEIELSSGRFIRALVQRCIHAMTVTGADVQRREIEFTSGQVLVLLLIPAGIRESLS